MSGALRGLRRALDGLYLAGGVVAAVFLVAILLIIVGQMVARWAGLSFPGAANYAGYCMAAASFFGFAHALNHGAHIRVSIVLTALGPRARWLDAACFGLGAVIATYLARYAIVATQWSIKFKDVSQGLDKTPIWIPQLAMCVGAVLLALAFWDHFARALLTGDSGVRAEKAEGADG